VKAKPNKKVEMREKDCTNEIRISIKLMKAEVTTINEPKPCIDQN